jgi:hypothetical protein
MLFLLLLNSITFCNSDNKEKIEKKEIVRIEGYLNTFNIVIDPEVILKVKGKYDLIFGSYTIHMHPLIYSALKGDNKFQTMEEYTKNIDNLLAKNKSCNTEKLEYRCIKILMSGLSSKSALGMIAHELGHIADSSYIVDCWYRFFGEKTQSYYHENEFNADAYAIKSSKSNAEGLVEFLQKNCYLEHYFSTESDTHPHPCERFKRALAYMNELYPEQKVQS